jgi:hypothetical protein
MCVLFMNPLCIFNGQNCNVPDQASQRNTANLICPLSDLIYWGFLDAFEMCMCIINCLQHINEHTYSK